MNVIFKVAILHSTYTDNLFWPQIFSIHHSYFDITLVILNFYPSICTICYFKTCILFSNDQIIHYTSSTMVKIKDFPFWKCVFFSQWCENIQWLFFVLHVVPRREVLFALILVLQLDISLGILTYPILGVHKKNHTDILMDLWSFFMNKKGECYDEINGKKYTFVLILVSIIAYFFHGHFCMV